MAQGGNSNQTQAHAVKGAQGLRFDSDGQISRFGESIDHTEAQRRARGGIPAAGKLSCANSCAPRGNARGCAFGVASKRDLEDARST